MKMRVRAGLGMLAAVGVAVSTPVCAQGFFEQLFGAQPAPSVEPTSPLQDVMPDFDSMRHRHHKKKKVALAPVDGKPELQKTTDLMHDKTLHFGDAVMLKDGIHVYTGGTSLPTHSKTQFVALDRARQLAPTARARLAALDATRSDAVTESRSDTSVANGFKITDSRGNSVRYVGP